MAAELLTMAKQDILSGGHADIAEYTTNSIHIGQNLLESMPDIVSKYDGKGLLVADSNTIQLLDKAVVNSLEHYVIEGKYSASWKLVESIRAASQHSNFLVALGSGTINDICKYVSHTCGKEYILFPTAPSMNGYTSKNASIILENGIKKSLKGQLPRDIYADTYVLTHAPARLINSGFADFICRSTARSDWLISHLLLGTEYSELPFAITENSERVLLENYRGLVKRDTDTIMALTQALFLSGVGMIVAGGSYPASQGEHMIAGVTELLDNHEFLHGERVGVATILMSKLQENICALRPKFHVTSLDRSALTKYFSTNHVDEFCKILSKKHIDHAKAEHINHILDEKWTQISEFIASKIRKSSTIENVLNGLGSPTLPTHIGWNTAKYHSIANVSFVTRDRFTFLDVAHHTKISL